MLLSTDAKVEFHPGSKMKFTIQENDECEDLGGKVQYALDQLKVEELKFDTDDGLGPSRIVVFDQKKGGKILDWRDQYRNWDKLTSPNVPYCYNLKRLAQYGMCETESKWYTFGFCSRSCVFDVPYDDERADFYWELKANYYEALPHATDKFYGKKKIIAIT